MPPIAVANFSRGEWIPRAEWPIALNNIYLSAITVVRGNKIYCGLGKNFSGFNTNFMIYDIEREEWTESAPIPEAVQRAGAVALEADGKIYVGMGKTLTKEADNSWYEFNPETNEWKSLTNFPKDVAGAIGFVLNGNIYVGGGFLNEGISNKTFYRFNPADNNGMGSWSLVIDTDLEKAAYAGSFVIGNDAYFTGGYTWEKDYDHTATFKFNTVGEISRVSKINDAELIAEYQLPACAFYGKGYLINYNGELYRFTPNSAGGTWRYMTNTPIGNMRYCKVVNGRIFTWTTTGAMYEYVF